MFRHRSFWIILLLTVATWVVVTMSENSDYPIDVHISYEGYDTARYAVTYSDTVLPVVINSNCFLAISRHYQVPKQHFVIQVQGDTMVHVGKNLFDDLVKQLNLTGVQRVSSQVETLRFAISERSSKGFVPQLKGVEFVFADQCGLSGMPKILPDTVWLYGDSASLCNIDELYTKSTQVRNISDSGYCTLALEPVWRNYSDVKSSHDSVRLILPVERYIEKKISVPVTFVSNDGQMRVRLYPERVDVTFWVMSKKYDEITSDMVTAEVEYVPSESPKNLPVRITRFPSYARVKQVTPTELQFVIIKGKN